MFALQRLAKHALSDSAPQIAPPVFDSMWKLFVAIGEFWGQLPAPENHRTQLYSFMINRIKLYPIYQSYYVAAKQVMDELVAQYGDQEAYIQLFTSVSANSEAPPSTPLALTRQMVSNEFISLYLALGGFKPFGAKNYLGYIGGPYMPGAPVPYRVAGEL